MSAFKDWTGISRKYAIPLLEYLDREHITRRDGEERVILVTAPLKVILRPLVERVRV